MNIQSTTRVRSWVTPIGLLLLGMGVPLLQSSAYGDTIFRDTFSDGDAQDGMPVTWRRINGDTEAIVEDADLVMRNLLPREFIGVQPLLAPFDDDTTSVRTQGRLREGDFIWAFARGYIASVRKDGTAQLASFFEEDVILSTPTDFRVMEEDVVIQVDVDALGDTISMWLWRPGESMPSDPLLTLTDDQLAPGRVVVGAGVLESSQEANIEAVFRYVHAATEHIPEPSTFLLASFGLFVGLVCVRRRRKHPAQLDSAT